MRASGASAVRSQPKLTTRQALASSSRVTRRGRSGRTSTPSSSKRATTFGWIAGSGSVPSNVLRTARPRSSARRWNSVAAIRLFAAPWRQTKTTVRSLMRDLLLHEDPCRVEEREGDQPNDCRHSDQHRVVDLPPEQHHQAPQRHERREPVADGDPRQQDTGTKDRADGSGVGAPDEALDDRSGPVTDEDGRDGQDEQERRQDDADRRFFLKQKTAYEIADERRRDDDGSGADHAHGDGDKKLAFSEPARLLHEALLEERNDHEATAERERPRLEEERQELAEHGANGHVATAHHEERYADKERGRRGSRRAYAEEGPIIQDTDNPAGDEDQCDFGPHGDGDDEGSCRERPLQPVLHPEFRQPVAGMQDQRDNCRAHAVEDGRHPWQPAEVDVERPERRDDDEVRQDERPPAGPRTPEAAADVGNPDADLDREGSRERLTDGDALTHLLLGQPLPLADHLAFHLADERDGAAEAEQAEAQIVPDKLPDGHAPWRLLPFHR